MLKLSNVKKHYKGFDLDCSMEVLPGCVTGLVGKNGSGKTTAFKAALGLISCDSGMAEVFGRPSAELGAREKEEIGVVLSGPGLCGELSIKDLVPILQNLYGKFRPEDFLSQCSRFSLPTDKKIKEFSTGMKQKLQVITALSHDAKLLILDEPTAGMDVVARDQILNLLREYMEQEERSILISSHISSDLEGFCDDLYLIDDGNILFHEETDVLLSDYALLKLTGSQYADLDKSYLLCQKKEGFGYSCLTDQRQFYQENYPEIAIEKGSIDELIMMMVRGKES